MGEKQLGVTFSSQELKVIEEIARRLDKPVASVIRECAAFGIKEMVQRVEQMERFLSEEGK